MILKNLNAQKFGEVEDNINESNISHNNGPQKDSAKELIRAVTKKAWLFAVYREL